jgi:hypothetical protein
MAFHTLLNFIFPKAPGLLTVSPFVLRYPSSALLLFNSLAGAGAMSSNHSGPPFYPKYGYYYGPVYSDPDGSLHDL